MPLRLRIGAHIEPRDPFWVQVREAVYQRAQQLDTTLVWLDADPTLLEVYSAEAVAELRGQHLDALIAIYIAEPLTAALLAASIPLVHLSETATSAPHMVAPVGLYDSAREAALFLAHQLGGRGDLLVVGGLCDAGEGGRSRLAAITDVAHAFPALTITHIPCLWSPQLAQPQLVAALHSCTRGFAGILGLSDSLAMLARDIAHAAGLIQIGTPVVGINGDPLALAAIAAGTMTATIETPAADFGCQAIDYACLLARNEPLPAPFGYQPQLVTAQNVAAVAVRKLIALAELPSRLVGVNREQEQRRLAQLEIGLEINRRVGGLMNRRQLSHLVADLIRTNYRYDSVQLLLWQPEQQLLLRDAPDAPDTPQQLVPVGALATALRDNRTVFLPNIRRAPREASAPLLGSQVVVPIRLGETILGLLDMQNNAPTQLSRQDLAGLQSLADQLGVAMQNAELYEAALAAQATAERADAIKTRLLANVSHELRTSVNVILGYSQSILQTSDSVGSGLPDELLRDVQQIYGSGEHLIQLINDLLDMSRADIGELDLFPEPIDTSAFLRAVFESMARSAPCQQAVAWELALPDDLPRIEADPIRLRQILLNLLQNAQCYTTAGTITLGAEATPTHLHMWVADTGSGISVELQDEVFEPFVRGDQAASVDGIGLGLSIARRLVALHAGTLTLHSTPGQGSTFHISLPWPTAPTREHEPPRPLLLISAADADTLALRDSLPAPVYVLSAEAELDQLLAQVQPSAVVFAPAEADEAAWHLLQRARAHPLLAHLPLMLYEQPDSDQATTGVVLKPLREQTLQPLLAALHPLPRGSILVVDDDAAVRNVFTRLFRSAFPAFVVQSAAGGAEALEYIRAAPPSLVVLDLAMPDIDGFAVLEAIRRAPATATIPVLVLSGTQLGNAELRRLDQMHVLFQSKEILSDTEIATSAHQLLAGDDRPAPQTSALVRRALAYIQHNYSRPVARSEIAAAIGVHKDYLSQIFQQELGISPWDYLLRYRIKQARALLRTTAMPITEIAACVGFQDSAYFSRLFRKEVGCSPRMYREG